MKRQNTNTEMKPPNTKEVPSPKPKNGGMAAAFGIWSLEFVWCLVFGIWCFVNSSIVD
jgi:hypothetical protein